MVQEKSNVVDMYTPMQFLQEVVAEFGAAGAVEFYGWVLLLSSTGGKTRADMLSRLVALGVSKSTAYRAADSVRRLAVRLYKNEGRLDELPDFPELAEQMIERVRAVDLSGLPRRAMSFG